MAVVRSSVASPMRHTKIIATLGPASSAPATLDALIDAGVDVFRLNFSHGTHDSHAALFRQVRDAASRANRHVAVLQDLGGPKIRTGPLTDHKPVTLVEGAELRIAAGEGEGDARRICTPYAPLITSARPGNRLLLDDGRIELRVTAASRDELTTVVLNGGELGEHKGINAPGVPLPASAITAKDEADLRFGIALGVDLVALSFVQTAEDVMRARDIAKDAGRDVPLIPKIERPQAMENLDAILQLSEGVMVARGDLGLEMPLEQVPRAQKEIVRCARTLGRPVIVATQVLESMRAEPRPTRAEVSDAANAVDEGVDAIMLAGETAAGAYPVRAVQTLNAIIADAESLPIADRIVPAIDSSGRRHWRALCEAAITLATSGQADAIVAITRLGRTAALLSSLRPRAPIYAVTPSDATARRLALTWGVTALVSQDKDAPSVERALVALHRLPMPCVVVFVNVSADLSRADGNFLNVQRLGG
jgi:pyruvate kinase